MTHIDDMVAYVRGELGEAELANAREHVEACAECRAEAEAIGAAFSMLEETEIEAPTNFAHRTAQLAAKSARVPAKSSVWDVVARIATRPIFGYPAWAVSAAVHLFALGGLTLVMVERAEDRKPENDAPKFAFKTPREMDTRPLDTGEPVRPPGGEFATFLGDRQNDAVRQELLRKHGGAETAQAVGAGLDWMTKKQLKDGSWPTEGGQPVYRTGVTALATLAYLGHGDSHVDGAYRQTVSRAFRYLKAQQNLAGRFGPDQGAVLPQHAAATMAFAEAFAMTGDLSLREPLVNAVGYLAASRSPRGGWGASMGASPDAVTTAWSAAALRLADAAGIDTARAPLAAATAYLDRLTGEDGRTGLREAGAYPNGWVTPTAAALFARRWTGLGTDEAARRAEQVAEAMPADDYVALQFGALATLGSPAWNAANKALKDALLPRQNADGSFQGDKWAGYGGSVYATAMATLTLETYYRYPAS
ncbi:MAG: zf-HC2 domain-containing protein [Planctomycetes bacterium]|nr:zf-HC2 domain-containing protein [Planctomycetota bacterium]